MLRPFASRPLNASTPTKIIVNKAQSTILLEYLQDSPDAYVGVSRHVVNKSASHNILILTALHPYDQLA